jgi:hypothetical protein
MYVHLNLHNITLLNVTPSLIPKNPKEHMCSVGVSLHVVTFPSHISQIMTLEQSIKEFGPRARVHHVVIIVVLAMLIFVLFHNVPRYINPPLLRIHVNSPCLLHIMYTLVTMCMVVE